jgi:hypothetical protein
VSFGFLFIGPSLERLLIVNMTTSAPLNSGHSMQQTPNRSQHFKRARDPIAEAVFVPRAGPRQAFRSFD